MEYMPKYTNYYNIYNHNINHNEYVIYNILDNLHFWSLGNQIYRIGGPAYKIYHNNVVIYEAWYRNGYPYILKYYDANGNCIKNYRCQ